MRIAGRGHRRIIALCVALAVSIPGFALSVDDVDVDASFLLVFTAPPTGYGTASPANTQLLGASLPLRIVGPFFVEPIIEFFGMPYEWTDANATAVPTRIEAASEFFTLGTLISLQAGVSFPLAPVVAIGGALGLDFLLRFPLDFTNTDPTSISGQQPALGYFFSAGRFFYPETRLFVRWHISQPVDLVFNVRAFYPLFHAWDGLGQPFIDQFMMSAGLGFAIRLH